MQTRAFLHSYISIHYVVTNACKQSNCHGSRTNGSIYAVAERKTHRNGSQPHFCRGSKAGSSSRYLIKERRPGSQSICPPNMVSAVTRMQVKR